ncbi:hypothetical protein B0T26DRAFT_682007 [Lasiosphaeria miniovina]|uniref:Uncharacterized protein n=1 Tax=Lasiosphaeria miniovina TaxID=1954250 RepID=A0AA39ZR44_9PEZI|nr:uncharacterized protein B0T26DRAFT_682007 [Lasiosphaeria miniovina]KAK0701910.1 hypothetical protein B0T26DRAFT_682007 [Lasiosphaeria miniovina]
MVLSRYITAALQLACLATTVTSQEPSNPFDSAQTIIATSTSTCYTLPTPTAELIKLTYNGTVDTTLVSELSFYLDQYGQVPPLFGVRDGQTGAFLLFDISNPVQLGIVYPDQSAVVFNASGITVFSADCSSVLSLILPGFYDYLIALGGGGGSTKKAKKSLVDVQQLAKRQNIPGLTYPVSYYVDVVVFDECGHVPSDPFDVSLTVGGGFECLDRADIINNTSTQGDNGLYKWTCLWPSPASREQVCEIDLLRQLGYSRDDFGTAVPAPTLVYLLSQGLGMLAPLSDEAAAFLNSPYFSPEWSTTITGIRDLMHLEDLINSQQLDPNAVAANICLPFTDLTEYVWLKIRDPPGYQYLLTSVVDERIRFTSSMQFNEQIIGNDNASTSCVFSAPSTLPLTTPQNTDMIACNTAAPTSTAGVVGRKRATDGASACTATASSNSTAPHNSTTTAPPTTSTPFFLTTITYPHVSIATTCSELPARCDAGPATACEYLEGTTNANGNGPEFSGCLCGGNVLGRPRCFVFASPTAPVLCHTRDDCPGGNMDCIALFGCWNLDGGAPGYCFEICPRAFEVGQ